MLNFFERCKTEGISTDTRCKKVGLWSGRRSLKRGVIKAAHTRIPLTCECHLPGARSPYLTSALYCTESHGLQQSHFGSSKILITKIHNVLLQQHNQSPVHLQYHLPISILRSILSCKLLKISSHKHNFFLVMTSWNTFHQFSHQKTSLTYLVLCSGNLGCLHSSGYMPTSFTLYFVIENNLHTILCLVLCQNKIMYVDNQQEQSEMFNEIFQGKISAHL